MGEVCGALSLVQEKVAGHMRMYTVLRTPQPANAREYIYKVMLHTTRYGIMCYMYTDPDAVRCSYDHCYDTDLKEAQEDWNALIDENGWIRIPDPEPHAKRDDEIPV